MTNAQSQEPDESWKKNKLLLSRILLSINANNMRRSADGQEKANLKRESESILIAAENNAIKTNNILPSRLGL